MYPAHRNRRGESLAGDRIVLIRLTRESTLALKGLRRRQTNRKIPEAQRKTALQNRVAILQIACVATKALWSTSRRKRAVGFVENLVCKRCMALSRSWRNRRVIKTRLTV